MPEDKRQTQTSQAAQGVLASKVDSIEAQLSKKISSSENILIALSKDPSVDEMSAALGLAMILDRIGKHTTAIYSGQTPNALEFLQPHQTFEKDTNSLQDFIVALNKEKADHLRYKIEGDFVKVYITPYRTTINEKDLSFSHGDYNVDLVITFNVESGDKLDGALSEYGRIMHDATAINITIGVPGRFAELEWSEPTASSVCEMVVKLAEILGFNQITEDIATALLTGVVSSTNRFSNERTNPETMSIAARLMTAGANQQLISSNIMQPGHDGDQKINDLIAKEAGSKQPDQVPVSPSPESLSTSSANVSNNESPAQSPESISSESPTIPSSIIPPTPLIPPAPPTPLAQQSTNPVNPITTPVAPVQPAIPQPPVTMPVSPATPVMDTAPPAPPIVDTAPVASSTPLSAPIVPALADFTPLHNPVPSVPAFSGAIDHSSGPSPIPPQQSPIPVTPVLSQSSPEPTPTPRTFPEIITGQGTIKQNVAEEPAYPVDYAKMMEEELAQPLPAELALMNQPATMPTEAIQTMSANPSANPASYMTPQVSNHPETSNLPTINYSMQDTLATSVNPPTPPILPDSIQIVNEPVPTEPVSQSINLSFNPDNFPAIPNSLPTNPYQSGQAFGPNQPSIYNQSFDPNFSAPVTPVNTPVVPDAPLPPPTSSNLVASASSASAASASDFASPLSPNPLMPSSNPVLPMPDLNSLPPAPVVDFSSMAPPPQPVIVDSSATPATMPDPGAFQIPGM